MEIRKHRSSNKREKPSSGKKVSKQPKKAVAPHHLEASNKLNSKRARRQRNIKKEEELSSTNTRPKSVLADDENIADFEKVENMIEEENDLIYNNRRT